MQRISLRGLGVGRRRIEGLSRILTRRARRLRRRLAPYLRRSRQLAREGVTELGAEVHHSLVEARPLLLKAYPLLLRARPVVVRARPVLLTARSLSQRHARWLAPVVLSAVIIGSALIRAW
jgi:hypothetical protein